MEAESGGTHPPTHRIDRWVQGHKQRQMVRLSIDIKEKLEKSSGIKAATWQVEKKKKKKRGFQANDDGNYYANKDWTKLGARVSSVRRKMVNGKWPSSAPHSTPLA